MLRTSWIRLGMLCALSSMSFGVVGCNIGAISVNGQDDLPPNTKDNNKKDDKKDDKDNNKMSDPAVIDPGHVTVHRLNRAEYNNTIRDLLDLPLKPAETFPPDDFGYGFNNIADVLTVSPLLFEMYDKAAKELIDEAMKQASQSKTVKFEAENGNPSVGGQSGDFWNLWSNGELGQNVDLPADGKYRIKVRAYESNAGGEHAKMELLVNSRVVQTFDVTATRDNPAEYTYTGDFQKGNPAVSVRFINDYFQNGEDRNLYVDWVTVEGPLDAKTSNPQRDKIMVCEPTDDNDVNCAKQVLSSFGARAWRRPLTTAEVDELATFVDVAKAQGDGIDQGIQLALRAILLNAKFIFRVEQDQPDKGEASYDLSQYELASRLSYFLWSSMPDARLFELARDGKLNDDEVLRAEVKRMLADDRAKALVDNFATQWLYIDAVLDSNPDYELFPMFKPSLAQAMRMETYMFVSDWMQSDAQLAELLTANYTYLNGELAQHYQIGGVEGADFKRVEYQDADNRRGLLTHGSILTARSYPNRTSPVLRGVWVLEQLLCSEPPPPPADVEGLKENGVDPNATLRERLEAHRSDPSCIGCHQTMDPIGFGLENYDAVGNWRTMEKGQPIDSLGELPDGRSFSNAKELSGVLANDPKLNECMTEKMMTYALGRGIYAKYGESDYAQVHEITKALEGKASTHELITQIVLSKAFRSKRNPKDSDVVDQGDKQ